MLQIRLETCAPSLPRERSTKENFRLQDVPSTLLRGRNSEYASGRRRLRLPHSSAFSLRSDSIRAGASAARHCLGSSCISQEMLLLTANSSRAHPAMEHLGRHSSDAQIESYRPLPRPFAAICHPGEPPIAPIRSESGIQTQHHGRNDYCCPAVGRWLDRYSVSRIKLRPVLGRTD